jgi:pimeloyl-ACP methyl ester carboxylesterase
MRAGGIEGYLAELERREGPLPADLRARVLVNDAEALVASTTGSSGAPDFSPALTALRIPVLIYAGERDQPIHDLAQRAATEAHVPFVSLPGMNHGEVSRTSGAVLPHVTPFLASVRATIPTGE